MSQAQITQTNFVEDAQLVNDFRDVAKEGDRFAHGHVQHVIDVLAAIAHVQNLLFEACALAFFADQFHVSEKLHLDGHGAVALANFATTAGHVERKM